MENSCLRVQLDERSEKTESKTNSCSSCSPHLSLLTHQTQTLVCSKELLEERKRAKLARRNAESIADVREPPHTALQTSSSLFCYQLIDLETVNNTNKTF